MSNSFTKRKAVMKHVISPNSIRTNDMFHNYFTSFMTLTVTVGVTFGRLCNNLNMVNHYI